MLILQMKFIAIIEKFVGLFVVGFENSKCGLEGLLCLPDEFIVGVDLEIDQKIKLIDGKFHPVSHPNRIINKRPIDLDNLDDHGLVLIRGKREIFFHIHGWIGIDPQIDIVHRKEKIIIIGREIFRR